MKAPKEVILNWAGKVARMDLDWASWRGWTSTWTEGGLDGRLGELEQRNLQHTENNPQAKKSIFEHHAKNGEKSGFE